MNTKTNKDEQLAHPGRFDSGSSMESLDLDIDLVNMTGCNLQEKPKPTSKHQRRAKTMNELQLDQMGICEGIDSSDDESTNSTSFITPKPPTGSIKNDAKSAYAAMRARMRSRTLSLSGISALPDVLSSPMSSEEDVGGVCARKVPNGLKRSRCMRLDFDRLLPTQDFILNGGVGCTARKQADELTSRVSELRPYLFIGDVKAAGNTRMLKGKGITHIVNMAGATCENVAGNGFSYLTLTPADCESEDLSCLFVPIAAFIDNARCVGGKVLVHCFRGVSRSCTAAMAYIMLDEGVGFAKALEDLRRVRPVGQPNRGFMNALADLEKWQKRGTETPRIWSVEVQRGCVAVLKRTNCNPNRECVKDQVLVLEKTGRMGMEVFRGDNVSGHWWNVIVPVIDRFAEQIEKNQSHYPCALGHNSSMNVDSVLHDKMLQWQLSI